MKFDIHIKNIKYIKFNNQIFKIKKKKKIYIYIYIKFEKVLKRIFVRLSILWDWIRK